MNRGSLNERKIFFLKVFKYKLRSLLIPKFFPRTASFKQSLEVFQEIFVLTALLHNCIKTCFITQASQNRGRPIYTYKCVGSISGNWAILCLVNDGGLGGSSFWEVLPNLPCFREGFPRPLMQLFGHSDVSENIINGPVQNLHKKKRAGNEQITAVRINT